jgi:hypothetical protein
MYVRFLVLGLFIGFRTFGQIDQSIVVFSIHNPCTFLDEEINLDVYNDSNMYWPQFKINDSTFIFKINKTGKYFLIESEDDNNKSNWERSPYFNFEIDIEALDTIRYNLNWKRMSTYKSYDHPHPIFKKCGILCNGFEKDYFSNGTLRIIGNFKDGHPVDSVIEYNSKGDHAFSYYELKNLGSSVHREYYFDGKLKEEIIRSKDSVVSNFYNTTGVKVWYYFYSIINYEGYSIDYDNVTEEPLRKIVKRGDNYRAEYEWKGNKWDLVKEQN